jgi:tRNA/rRNA methyltransferase
MAGTDKTQLSLSGGPAIILVNPQMGENIGTVARAMYNFGLVDLRLVAPRDGWPNDRAVISASGATPVLDAARVYQQTKDAVADLHRVYATTARDRYMIKEIVTPAHAAELIRTGIGQGERSGILFGPERTGLVNDDISLADRLLTIPVNPAFASLNLGMAVAVIGYEWLKGADLLPASQLPTGRTDFATREELHGLFDHLEGELDATGFLWPEHNRPSMVRNLRNILERAYLTEQEVRTLRGAIKALREGRPRSYRKDQLAQAAQVDADPNTGEP